MGNFDIIWYNGDLKVNNDINGLYPLVINIAIENGH